MKIRIGVGAGGGLGAEALTTVVDGIASAGLDSLWLAEILTGAAIDPLVGLAWASGRRPGVKLGTTMLLPGRNPLRLAKAVADLDRLSGGRALVTFVPGLATEPERSSIGVDPAARGRAIEVLLPLVRAFWAGETVTWSGAGAGVGLDEVRLDAVSLARRPVQDPLEAWLGGMAPAALRRCGRMADGWLPSLCTPASASAGRQVIEAAAAGAGRAISDEHFGVSIGYAHRPLRPAAAAAMAARSRGGDPSELVPVGWDATRRLLETFVAVGFSKFVLHPIEAPDDWAAELAAMGEAVGDLQT